MQQANKTFSFLLLILIAVKNFGIIVFYSWGVSKPDGKGFLDFYIFLIIHFCSIVCLLIVTFQKIYIYTNQTVGTNWGRKYDSNWDFFSCKGHYKEWLGLIVNVFGTTNIL